MKLYPLVEQPAVQDSGHQGPEELFIQPLCPPRGTAVVDYPVS